MDHSTFADIQAEGVDLPAQACSCDPLKLIGPDLQRALQEPTHMFDSTQRGQPLDTPTVRARWEYALLTAREIR